MKFIVLILAATACNTMSILDMGELNFHPAFDMLSMFNKKQSRSPFSLINKMINNFERKFRMMEETENVLPAAFRMTIRKPKFVEEALPFEMIENATPFSSIQKTEEVQKVEEVVSVQEPEVTPVVAPFEDYAKCLELLQKAINTATQIGDAIAKKRYELLLPLSITLAQQIIADYQCWTNPNGSLQISKIIDAILTAIGDVPECAIEHLKHAAAELQQALNDLIKLHFEKAVAHLKEVIEILKDIKNCK